MNHAKINRQLSIAFIILSFMTAVAFTAVLIREWSRFDCEQLAILFVFVCMPIVLGVFLIWEYRLLK